MQKLKNYYSYIFVLFMWLSGEIFPAELNAQSLESFRIIKGVPHLPVLASTASVSSPVPGMMIFSHADKTVMVFSGGAWDNFTTTTNVASSSNARAYFQIINGVPVLPVMPTLTGAVRPGAMYYPSSGGGVRMNNGRGWHNPKQFVLEGEDTEYKQVISGRVNNVDGMIVFPVLSSAPNDVEAGAVYITNRLPRMKVFDGTNWLELAVDLYPNTPVPPVKIGNTTWAPVNVAYDNTHPHGLMYQWHRKYGQEYVSTGNTAGTALLSDGSDILNTNRFYTYGLSPFDWCNVQQPSWDMTVGYNPCPLGWRVPTQAELSELNQAGSTWVSSGGPDDLPGRWYGGNHSTDRVGSVFLPASGRRSYDAGIAGVRNSTGYYWSSVTSGTNAVSLNLRDSYSDIITTSYKASGYSVRCVKESYSATITPGGNTWFCEGGSVILTASAGVSYLWSTGDTTREITVSYTGDYYVTITFPDGSSQTSASITVTSIPWTDPGTLSGDQTVCVGETTVFSSTKSGGTWSSENISIATVASNGLVRGVAPGTTTIRYNRGGTCWYYGYRDVTVVALPALGGATEVCEGLTANVTPNTGGTWSSDDPSVATVTDAGVVTGVSAGSVTLTFTDSGTLCSNTKSFTVKDLPVANIILPVEPIISCDGLTLNFEAENAGAGATYAWSFGVESSSSGSNTRTPSASWYHFGPDVRPITLTVTKNGCSSTDQTNVILIYTPHISDMSTSICSGETFTVRPVDGTNGIVPSFTFYSWSAPSVSGITGATSGMNISPISGTLVNTTNSPIDVVYTVTPTPLGGECAGPPFTVTVTVDPVPVIHDKVIKTCSRSFVYVPQNGVDGNIVPSGTTYSWVVASTVGVAGGTSGTDQTSISALGLINTMIIPGPAVIVYTVTPKTGDCVGDPFSLTVIIDAAPFLNPIADQTYCAGETVPLQSLVGGGNYTDATFTWTNSNTAIGLGASGSGNIPGFVATNSTSAPIQATITVTPSIVDCWGVTCTGTPKSYTITVNPTPLPPIVEILCGEKADYIFLTGLPSGGGMITDLQSGEKYPFKDPDPSVGITAVHGSPTSYNFRLTDAYGCSVDFTVTICCPGLTAPTVEVLCVPEHVDEHGALVMDHSEVVFTGFPSSDCTITQIRPSVGTGTLVTSDPFNLGSLRDGTYTYRITDKDGCSVDVTFVVDCHFDVVHLGMIRSPVCGGNITADLEFSNLPAEGWTIIPGQAGGAPGGTTPIVGSGTTKVLTSIARGDYSYEVYNKHDELISNVSVTVPYPGNGITPSVTLRNEDCTVKNTASVSFDHLPNLWTINIGTWLNQIGEGSTVQFDNVPKGTYSVTVLDRSTNCISNSSVIKICE